MNLNLGQIVGPLKQLMGLAAIVLGLCLLAKLARFGVPIPASLTELAACTAALAYLAK